MPTVEITAENLESTLAKPGLLVLDFWAEWCGPCRSFAPIFAAAADRHPDAVFGKVNTEEQQEIAGAFSISSIPTLMVFRDGVMLFEQPGMLPGHTIDQLLGKIREIDMDDVRRRMAEHEATAAGVDSDSPSS